MNTKIYLMFCTNGDLLVFFNIDLSRNLLKLSNFKLYKTNFFGNIKDVKIYHDEAIIIIAKKTASEDKIFYSPFDKLHREKNELKFIKE